VSSISSSRKGRPNAARDADYLEVRGNFRQEIYRWRGWEDSPARMREEMQLEGGEELFEVVIDCLALKGFEPPITLDPQTLSVPEGSKISKGPVPIYRFHLSRIGALKHDLAEVFVTIPDDAEILDLNAARTATESEIKAAVSYEPPPPEPEPEPPAPVYNRIPRMENDSASYLGFSLGRDEKTIRSSQNWVLLAFNLPVPQVVGHVAVSFSFQAHDEMDLRVFDALGDCVLQKHLRGSREISIDQTKLGPGDYLIAFKCSVMEGGGSYNPPHSRSLPGKLPERPILNDLILWPTPDESDEWLGQCGVPLFEFKN